jgi:MYXO-CTERM domain-containing protein
MEPPSPARLYATLVGAVLFVAGILGFFQDLSWLNYLYVASGAIGLLLAAAAARPYALCVGTIYTALAISDFASRGWPHLAIGLLGLAAFGSTRRSSATHGVPKERRDGSKRLKPRAKAAAKSS